MNKDWNADLYQSSHSFVWEYGRDLLGLLAPQPGERILDVGCGTGQLTADIAQTGAITLGIDQSESMIVQARGNFPSLQFEVRDVCDLPYGEEFDAIFSNAVLHWVTRADEAAASLARALKPGGRLVIEMGGHGNVREVLNAVSRALGSEAEHPWYYPSIGEYASLLERHRLEPVMATLFDRPTKLEGGAKGLANWFAMFGGKLTPKLQQTDFMAEVERLAAPHLLREGTWFADYRRLRVVAKKI